MNIIQRTLALLVFGTGIYLAAQAQGISVTATFLAFIAQPGGSNPPSQWVTVSEPTGRVFFDSWRASIIGATWLSVSPTSGLGRPGDGFLVSVNIAGLASGTYTGTIQITGNAPATATATVTLYLGENAIGVLNGASYSRDVSPNSVISLFGTNLSTRVEAAIGLPLPVTLAGIQVLVNNISAPLFFASLRQIKFPDACRAFRRRRRGRRSVGRSPQPDCEGQYRAGSPRHLHDQSRRDRTGHGPEPELLSQFGAKSS